MANLPSRGPGASPPPPSGPPRADSTGPIRSPRLDLYPTAGPPPAARTPRRLADHLAGRAEGIAADVMLWVHPDDRPAAEAAADELVAALRELAAGAQPAEGGGA